MRTLTSGSPPPLVVYRTFIQPSGCCAMMQAMKLFQSLRKLEEELEEAASMGSGETKKVLRNIGWVSAGITVLAVGVVIGRELRCRYKFNRRTPYDAYAHAGDSVQDVEFGVGI